MPKLSRAKTHGIHYTPSDLAAFLAEATIAAMPNGSGTIRALDPACGDGGLLKAFANAVPAPLRSRIVLCGYERDATAVRAAQKTLDAVQVADVRLERADFLNVADGAAPRNGDQLSLFDGCGAEDLPISFFDVIIANPPYVRTQVLGAERAQSLARSFRLSGRVDLYHAFVRAMARVLRPGGTLGLLTSNRFLFIESGAALRRLLRSEFTLRAIYDLGDTKLFSAAVLPVIVLARRSASAGDDPCDFTRIYEYRGGDNGDARPRASAASVLDALRCELTGLVQTPQGLFSVQRGTLHVGHRASATWTLGTPQTHRWLAAVAGRTARTFDDVAQIRVGIKTTADAVFIRDDWDELPPHQRPEPELLHPLVTHHDDFRWAADPLRLGTKKVLYPHRVVDGRKAPIDLASFPRARAYLDSHRERLAARHYVVDSGRQWFEIWVPHHPSDWAQPKIVFPDISEFPRFFLECSGAIVNGDCYWITLRPGQDERWLWLLLAVANSSFSTAYYDTAFHNKLYAGRRRFMTQYVKHFPLPDLSAPAVVELVRLTRRLAEAVPTANDQSSLAAELDRRVWQSFGVTAQPH